MNGTKRYLLDTNAIVSLLSGNRKLRQLLEESNWVGISVVSELEFLSYTDISEDDCRLFAAFKSIVDTVDLCSTDRTLMNLIIRSRQERKLKIPDAVILASGLANDAKVITADRHLLKKHPEATLPMPCE